MLTVQILEGATLTASEDTIFDLVDEIRDLANWANAIDALREYIAWNVKEV